MGATYYRFRKIHLSKKHPGLCKATCPKTDNHPYGAIADLINTLKAVFGLNLSDYLSYVIPDEFEDTHFWNLKKLEKQGELLSRLEQIIENYCETIMNALAIGEKPELAALLATKKLKLTKEDVEYQAIWIRRWINDLRKGFFIGYVF